MGSARYPFVLRVRSGCCALFGFKLAAKISSDKTVS
ncbi:MAG TPA: DNA metabolism protein [Leclercia adecarboxylata]|nr:DNA metabolism protein [Leclercia adecarboxylata]